MASGDTMQGRRREDVRLGDLPGDPQPGDYWKVLRGDGQPVHSDAPSNLTGTMWQFVAPIGGVGTLSLHTVREHEDGTASIRRDDGSSNSVMFTGSTGRSWHGYLEHGVWEEV